jgi:CRISPR-associated protein Cmr4
LKLRCVTNLHVGSGDVNYSVIDNEVERDPVLQDVPIIHATGVKGALRAHFAGRLGQAEADSIFGSSGGAGTATKPGSHKFFDAFCLARPLRLLSSARADVPCLLGVGLDALRHYCGFLQALGFSQWSVGNDQLAEGSLAYTGLGNAKHVYVEGDKASPLPASLTPATKQALADLVGEPYVLAPTLRHYPLPAAARNSLGNVQIPNLWYEEFVPHMSIFYTVIMTPGSSELGLDFDAGPIQFGGNSSVGYGQCHLEVFACAAPAPPAEAAAAAPAAQIAQTS